MHERESLIKRFAEAGLVLELAKAPMEKNNPDIFQLDIPRKFKGNTRTEWFRIWPGHENNRVIVQNTDRRLQQLVLMVKEEKRTFTRTENYHERVWKKLVDKPVVGGRFEGLKVKSVHHRDHGRAFEVVLEGTTPENKRHYLLGVDERQLFICQLPRGCSTVSNAHQSLKRPALILAEGKAPGRTIRQGEWFFVNLTDEEKVTLETLLRERPYLIHKKEAIGRGGHPHIAEEIVRVPGAVLKHGWPLRANTIYVRGSVTHVDHAPVRSVAWRRVIRNNEVGSGGEGGDGAFMGRGGVLWID